MGDGVESLHLAGEKMLAAVGLGKILQPHIQHHIHALARRGRGEAEQGTDDLADAAIKIVHIGAGLIEIEIFGQHRLGMKNRRLIVQKTLQINIQLLGDVVQRVDVDSNGTVFIFGNRGLAFSDHGRELFDGVAAAFSVFFYALTDMAAKGTHGAHLLIDLIITIFSKEVNKKFHKVKLRNERLSVK